MKAIFRYVYDSIEQSIINIEPNQNRSATINLPCTLDSYDGTKEYFFHFYDPSSDAINITDFAFPEIGLETPMSYTVLTYQIDMMVTYSNNAMIIPLIVNVNGICSFDN